MGESPGFLAPIVGGPGGLLLVELASRKRKSEALLALTEADPSIGFPAALLSRRVVLALASLPPPQESQSLPPSRLSRRNEIAIYARYSLLAYTRSIGAEKVQTVVHCLRPMTSYLATSTFASARV